MHLPTDDADSSYQFRCMALKDIFFKFLKNKWHVN